MGFYKRLAVIVLACYASVNSEFAYQLDRCKNVATRMDSEGRMEV